MKILIGVLSLLAIGNFSTFANEDEELQPEQLRGTNILYRSSESRGFEIVRKSDSGRIYEAQQGPFTTLRVHHFSGLLGEYVGAEFGAMEYLLDMDGEIVAGGCHRITLEENGYYNCTVGANTESRRLGLVTLSTAAASLSRSALQTPR